MNRHQLASLSILFVLFFGTSAIHAQTTQPGGGATTAVTNKEWEPIQTASAITPEQLAKIKARVTAEVTRLASADIAAQGNSRDILINAVLVNGQPKASPAYLDAYTLTLGAALAPLTHNPDFRVRLNTAIVAAKVADRTDNTRLMDVIVAFMKDDSPAVALWGMKDAHAILPAIVRNPLLVKDNSVLPLIVPAVMKNSSGRMVDEAYQTLSIPDRSETVVPEMLKLLAWRVQRYAKEAVDSPAAENRAMLFLSDGRVFKTMTPEQKVQTVQLMSDMMQLAAQRVATVNRTDREALLAGIVQSAKAFCVLGAHLEDANLTSTATALTRGIHNLPPGQLVDLTKAVYEALAISPKVAGKIQPLKTNPSANSATSSTPTPAPASGPAK